MAEDEQVERCEVPNLEDFIMNFMNLLVLNGVVVTNKIEKEKTILQHIVDSDDEFCNVRLKYKEYSCVIENLNHRVMSNDTLDVDVIIFL